jgi:hypothetical protein
MMPYKLYINPDGDHFHRCPHCGQLDACNASCLEGKFHTHGHEEIMSDGVLLDSAGCCTDCYNRRDDRYRVNWRTLAPGLALNSAEKETA